MAAILLAIVLLLTVAALPGWGYSADWSWYPSAALALLFIAGICVLAFGWG